ncbi:MAG TPA: hypothetical protein P5205_17875 [Candidatus Paceibacterota bacterium]|nr:hypothetical protein [Verrucomicrobiota bacterium]HSA12233.1 hypothetical protein [Candidatus Paceibacterota bacterium]
MASSSDYFRKHDYLETPQRVGHHFAHDGYATECGKCVGTVDFDFDAIDARLGTAPPETDRDRAFRQAGDLLEVLCVWLADSQTISSAGLRAFALAWTLRPGAFEERSIAELAKRLGVTRQSIGKYCTSVYEMGHGIFQGKMMNNSAAREPRRQIALEYHRRVGHRLRRKQ